MIDFKAFEKMTYGLYLVSTRCGDVAAGCVVNTLAQVTTSPIQMTIAINKENYTTGLIERSGLFTAVALCREATMDLIGRFGFHCSRDTEKFEGFRTRADENGVPFVCEQAAARFSCKVVNRLDLGTHILFVGELLAAEVLEARDPMTYAYYHEVKKGVTPPKASSYQPPAPSKGYRCKVCGYILESETIPEGFVCPVCGRGGESLERVSG